MLLERDTHTLTHMCTRVGVGLEYTHTVEKIEMALPSICGMSSALDKKGVLGMGMGRWNTLQGEGRSWKLERWWWWDSLGRAQHRIPLRVCNGSKSAQMKNRVRGLWKYKHQRQDLIFFPHR